MSDIWLTAAARRDYETLADPEKRIVADLINGIDCARSHRLGVPGAPAATPFLVLEPGGAWAPAVVYRRTMPAEEGDWLVVSLLPREDYRLCRFFDSLPGVPPVRAWRLFAETPPSVILVPSVTWAQEAE